MYGNPVIGMRGGDYSSQVFEVHIRTYRIRSWRGRTIRLREIWVAMGMKGRFFEIELEGRRRS